MIQKDIIIKGEKVALLIPKIKTEERIKFFTNPDDQLQIAAFKMSKGEKIQPHLHLENERNLDKTVEIILVQNGVLTVTFHESEDDDTIIKSVNLKEGDVILLKSGIHGFVVNEDCRFLEFKQGPFNEKMDKKKLYNN